MTPEEEVRELCLKEKDRELWEAFELLSRMYVRLREKEVEAILPSKIHFGRKAGTSEIFLCVGEMKIPLEPMKANLLLQSLSQELGGALVAEINRTDR